MTRDKSSSWREITQLMLLAVMFAAIALVATTGMLNRTATLDESNAGSVSEQFPSELPDYGLAQLSDRFDIAFVGRVAAISEPEWNSADGSRWDGADSEFTAPLLFTRVSFEIMDDSRGSETLRRVLAGSEVADVWFLGDPTGGTSNPATGSDGLRVGDVRLVFAFYSGLPYEDGYTPPVLRSEVGTATWVSAGDVVWPHSHWQARQLRALSDRELIPSWEPDPTGRDEAVTRIRQAALLDLLDRYESGDSDIASTLASIDPTISLYGSDNGANESPDAADLRAAAIEDTVLTPLRKVIDIETATLELHPDGIAPPVLTIIVLSRDSIDLDALEEEIALIRSAEPVRVVIASDNDGEFAELVARP